MAVITQSFHYSGNHSYVAKVTTFCIDNAWNVVDEDFFSRHITLEVIFNVILFLSEDGCADPNKGVEKASKNESTRRQREKTVPYTGAKSTYYHFLVDSFA